MVVYKKSPLLLPLLLTVSCLITAAASANILDIIEWGIGDKAAELRAEEDDAPPGGQRSCLCDGPSCICCIDFNLTFIDLGGPGCVRMKYISQDEGFAVNISYGNSLLHSQMVKGPDPEPTCMNLITRVAQLCARLTELAPTSDGLRGCLQLEPTLLGESQFEFPLGCFRSGPDGMAMEPAKNNTSTDEDEEIEEPPGTGTPGINTSAIIQAVNESAEEGIAFFSNLLGLAFGRPNATETVDEDDEEPAPVPVKSTTEKVITVSPSTDVKTQRKSKKFNINIKPNRI